MFLPCPLSLLRQDKHTACWLHERGCVLSLIKVCTRGLGEDGYTVQYHARELDVLIELWHERMGLVKVMGGVKRYVSTSSLR